MAPSLSNAKLLAAPLADALSQLTIYRRVIGYAAGAGSRGGEEASGGKKGSSSAHQTEEKAAIKEHSGSTTSTAWGPDPVTGYYRPGDRVAAIDTVDLRDVALNHKEITKQQD